MVSLESPYIYIYNWVVSVIPQKTSPQQPGFSFDCSLWVLPMRADIQAIFHEFMVTCVRFLHLCYSRLERKDKQKEASLKPMFLETEDFYFNSPSKCLKTVPKNP